MALPDAISRLARFPLAHLPTPLVELRNLSRSLGGPRVMMKRDDMTGLAMGGNKTRKLEFLIADALAQGADTVVTAGAAQSNHCRQTAAAAAVAGLKCELVLGGEEPRSPEGTVLLDALFGARFHWTPAERRGERLEEIAQQAASGGARPYVIPYGGSNPVGACGYVLAMTELIGQLKQNRSGIDAIVIPSSSGGTQAGIVVGAEAGGFHGDIIGIRIDKGEPGAVPYESELAQLASGTAKRLGMTASFRQEDFVVEGGYLGRGYGVVGDLEREAIRLVARTEGILLDPVYTGRAMGALIDMIRRGKFSRDSTVLFWHTGGTPAIFAYAREIL